MQEYKLLTHWGLVRTIFCFKLHIFFVWLLKNTWRVVYFLHWNRKTCPFHKGNKRSPAHIRWLHGPGHPYYFNLLLPKLPSEGLHKRLLPVSRLLKGKAVTERCKVLPSIFSHVTYNTPLSNSKSQELQVCDILVPKLSRQILLATATIFLP